MIRIYTGLLGSGKTLSMVRDLHNDYYKRNRKVSSNLSLNFPADILDAKFFKQFSDGITEDLNNICVGIDEFHIFMDSRRSGTKKNRVMSYFILQTRKRNVTLRATTQFFTQVDLRLRDVTDYITECDAFIKLKNKYIRVTPLMISQGLTKEEKDNLWIRNKNYASNGQLLNTQMFYAKPYFNLYDTNQIINFEEIENAKAKNKNK